MIDLTSEAKDKSKIVIKADSFSSNKFIDFCGKPSKNNSIESIQSASILKQTDKGCIIGQLNSMLNNINQVEGQNPEHPEDIEQSKMANSFESRKSSNDNAIQEEEQDVVHPINNHNSLILKKKRADEMWANTLRSLKGYLSFKKMLGNYQLVGDAKLPTGGKVSGHYIQKLADFQTEIEIKEEEKVIKNLCDVVKVPVLKPDSIFIEIWNIIMSFLMIYTLFIMPYRLSFIESSDELWDIFENVVDFLFLTDVAVTLNTAYQDEKRNLVESRKLIFWKYLKGWLILDVLTSIPQNLFLRFENSFLLRKSDILRLARLSKLNRLLKAFRFIKITRFFRACGFFHQIYEFMQVNYGFSRLISFLFTIITLIHIVACLWYYLPKLYDDNDCWVINLGYQDLTEFRKYLISLYWSVTTIFTVGFGDIHAFNVFENIFSIFWMVFGVIIFSIIIGTLSSILAQSETKENHLQLKLATLEEFSKNTKLQSILKEKIKRIIIYNSNKAFSNSSKAQIFNDIPSDLKVEIASSMQKGCLQDIKFLSEVSDPEFLAIIIPFLMPMNFFQREIIYEINDTPNAIFFISNGRVFFAFNYIPYIVYTKGSHFGEIDILEPNRFNQAISAEKSDLLMISKANYQDIVVKKFPEIHEQLKNLAKKRFRKNKKLEEKLLKRLQNQSEGNNSRNDTPNTSISADDTCIQQPQLCRMNAFQEFENCNSMRVEDSCKARE